MRYMEFYNTFQKYLTNNQIAQLQETAFKFYKDAHGYKPRRKSQKQFAYSFVVETLNMMDWEEFKYFLDSYGVPNYAISELYDTLGNIEE
jgi:hypothetical protein